MYFISLKLNLIKYLHSVTAVAGEKFSGSVKIFAKATLSQKFSCRTWSRETSILPLHTEASNSAPVSIIRHFVALE